jgi:hypothetical protein
MTIPGRLRVVTAIAIALCLFVANPTVGLPKEARPYLAGSPPLAGVNLPALGDLPGTNRLRFALALPLRNPDELNSLLQGMYTLGSTNYHQYLTPGQFTGKFGPAVSDYEALIRYARTNGFKVEGTHPSRTVLDVSGPVSAVEKCFQVKMKVYRHPTEARTFYSPDTRPSVDASLPFRILSVSGLDNYSLPRPASLHVMAPNQNGGVTPNAGSGPGGQYIGHDFRYAYLQNNRLNGAGQSVALLEFDGYYSNDITAYETLASLPAVAIANVPVNGGVSTPGSADDEVSLDIEMVISMATNVSKVLVYEAPEGTPWQTILGRIADEDLAAQISCSWSQGGGPDPASEQIFKQMAAQGQSFFTSSGDSDAYNGFIAFPDDSPNITIVGGTSLTTITRSGGRSAETVWNQGLDITSSNYLGSSGGISQNYAIPTWQLGINSFLTNGGSAAARNVPDVALTAANIYITYGNGQSESVVGTSCAAPLWAGVMALVNQREAALGQPAAGFVNPALYEIANESTYSSAFFDITNGNNTWPGSTNAFYAVPGYDLCTGLGTPKGTNLINILVAPDPLIVVSNYGFSAVRVPAGSFNVVSQTYSLSNTAAAPLNWALTSAPAWLTVSNTGGTLAPGGNDNVVVSLNTVATNLTAGTYTANVWFTNITGHVGHSRFFTLALSDPLVVLPPTNFYFNGPPGGPFLPAANGIVLTNPSPNSLSWSVNNTSIWFNVSPASGSLPPGAQISVAVTPAPAAASLSDGLYASAFQFTNLASQFVQAVTAIVSVGIVQNGGFETGDFTDWTLVGNTVDASNVFNAVVSAGSLNDGTGTNYIHSGSYGAFLGDTNLATLSQSFQTTPGQNYRLSFWVDNPVTGSGQLFMANWITNGSANQVFSLTNPPALTWTNVIAVVSATGTNTTLQFAAQNPPGGFGLDDITVDPLSPPIFTTQPTNLMVFAGSNATFSGAVTGIGPFGYQWLDNGARLGNGGNISGATANVLAISGAIFGNTGNYALVVTNNYGSVTSSIATLTVIIPPEIGGAMANPNGTFSLTLLGAPGSNYVLEATTNLSTPADWHPLATNTLNTNGTWLFMDYLATNHPQQFYRLEVGP